MTVRSLRDPARHVHRGRATVLALLVVVAGACTPQAKEDAALLVAAVETFRGAPEARKHEVLAALGAVPCNDTAVCDAKRDCVEYAHKVVAASSLQADVKQKLADVKSGKLSAESPEALALYGTLDRGTEALKAGEAALLRCDEKLQRLKRR